MEKMVIDIIFLTEQMVYRHLENFIFYKQEDHQNKSSCKNQTHFHCSVRTMQDFYYVLGSYVWMLDPQFLELFEKD